MNWKKDGLNWAKQAVRLIWLAAGILECIIIIAWMKMTGAGLALLYTVTFLMIFLSMILNTAIHELGHLLGGLATGYRFVCVQVAGMTLSFDENGRLRTGRNPVPGASGYCQMEPPEMKEGKMPYLLYYAGGILANLLAAVGLGAAAWMAGATHPTAQMICLAFAIRNAASALSNGIPVSDLSSNDGMDILTLRNAEGALEAWHRGMKAGAQSFRGVLLRDMPEELFYLPTDEELRNSPFSAGDALHWFSRLTEQDRDEEAMRLADRLLAEGVQLSGGQRASLHVNRAFYEMMQGVRTQEECKAIADQWLDEPTKRYIRALGNSPNGLRVQFALAMLVKGHIYKADQIEEEYDEAVKKDPRVRDPERDKEYFRKVREAYARRKGDTEEIHR